MYAYVYLYLYTYIFAYVDLRLQSFRNDYICYLELRDLEMEASNKTISNVGELLGRTLGFQVELLIKKSSSIKFGNGYYKVRLDKD